MAKRITGQTDRQTDRQTDLVFLLVKILVTAQTQLRSYSEQQRAFGNSNICNCVQPRTGWANFSLFCFVAPVLIGVMTETPLVICAIYPQI